MVLNGRTPDRVEQRKMIRCVKKSGTKRVVVSLFFTSPESPNITLGVTPLCEVFDVGLPLTAGARYKCRQRVLSETGVTTVGSAKVKEYQDQIFGESGFP